MKFTSVYVSCSRLRVIGVAIAGLWCYFMVGYLTQNKGRACVSYRRVVSQRQSTNSTWFTTFYSSNIEKSQEIWYISTYLK